MADKTAVIVIGGGYAGVMAANRLTQREDVTVTLINPRPTFVERIRLHQLVGGTHDAVQDFADVLPAGVRLVIDTATHIDAAERTVALAGGGTVHYDHLVYAAGSDSAHQGVPGAAEHAHPVASLEAAQRLRTVLDRTPRSAAVTVVGGGASGIEVAAELAEEGRVVTLVCGEVLGRSLHPRARRAVAKRLAELHVTVLEGLGATVTSVAPGFVALSDGRDLPSDVTIWTAGFAVPDLAARSGLSTDALGRLVTDETLTSIDDERIVAAGDSAAPSGVPFRMGCQSAVQLGPQAAETVLRRIAGAEPAPISVGFASQCLSLGRRRAVVQLSRRDDTPIPLHFSGGRLAAKIKEFLCWGTVWGLAYEARRPGRRSWWSKHQERRHLLPPARRDVPVLSET